MNNIYFSDIESIIIDSYHLPIMIGYSHNYEIKIFDIKNEINKDNSFNIIKHFFESINQYKGVKKIFFHNMANYDGYFILEYLTKNNIKYKIINKNNSIYKISIPEYKIQILDSFLLIPYSLENACNYFNKKYFKTVFNFALLNEFNYLEQKSELIKYYINDLLCLEELYNNFINKIKIIFNVDQINSLTLTSLVHKQYLNNFNTKYKFNLLSDKEDEFIRNSYIGGIVDIYKPFGKRIIELDVNSMYPSVMSNTKFGIGKPIYTNKIKNITDFCEKYIGFVKCNVKSIKNMKYPTLSIKYKDKLIQPIGEFKGIFYTKEILDCIINKEYEFIAIEGYYFIESDYIFKDFIESLYNIRLEAKEKKDKGLEILTKKCMVSLYGRFGIKLDDDIIDLYEYKEIEKINNIKNIQEFNEYVLVRHTPDQQNISLNNKILKPRIDWSCIVSSESRILINKIKRKINIYYSDTDSIYIDKKDINKIQEYTSQTELGKFKIEREYKYIIFIALKTYIGKTTQNEWIFKAKSINIKELELKTVYINDYFYKYWFKIIYNKLIFNSNYNVKINIKRIFNKDIKNFTIQEKNVEIVFELNYDKRKKIFKKCVWIDTKPIKIIKEEDELKLKYYIEQENLIKNDKKYIENIYKEAKDKEIDITKQEIEKELLLEIKDRKNKINQKRHERN